MPAKAPVDENVRFLYSCLIRSDYHYIDFHMVANDFAINPAAARMRWSRLRKNIALNSSFKNDPNLSVIFGQKKKRKVVDGPPAPPGKKGKVDVKMEGEDDDEVVFVGDDMWKVKAEMKAEGTEGVGQSSGHSVGSIGADVMGDDYQTGPGGPGQGATHDIQGVDDALARVMDPMLFEISPGKCIAGNGVLGLRSLSLGPVTVGEASGTGRQTFSMPPGPYAPVIAVRGGAPSPAGFASGSTTIGTLAAGEAEATGFHTEVSGNDGHVSSPTTPFVDAVTETRAIDNVEKCEHAIFGKAPASDAILETSVTQSEASCIEGDTIILLSAAAAPTSPANDGVLDTIVVDTTVKAPIDLGLDDCSQKSKSLAKRTSRKGSQRNDNNYGSDSELTEISENEGNHGSTIVLKIPNDGEPKVASSVKATMSGIPVDEIPARALRARREKKNKVEIPGLGEDGEEELEEEDYEDEGSDGEWVDGRK